MPIAIVTLVLLASLSARVFADTALTLDANGRTLKAASHVSSLGTFRIDMPVPKGVSLCGSTFPVGKLGLFFTESSEVEDPDVLPRAGDGVPHDGKGFRVNPTRSGFLAYNIVQSAAVLTDRTTFESCADTVKAKVQQLADRKADVESATRTLAVEELEATRARENLKNRQLDAASYAGIAGSGQEVARLLGLVDTARTEAQNADKELDAAREKLRLATKALEDFPENVRKELGEPLDRARYLIDGLRAGAVLKIGGVFVGDRREAVFYDFSTRADNTTLQLSPMGDYPVVTDDERVFAVIANVDTSRHPYRFRLAATITAGTAVNIEPARPTFPVGGEAALAAEPTEPVFAKAYRDVFLSIRDAVPPNGIAEVSILTERPTAADPKKLELVTLVEKAKYPQFRARYRFNFASGVYRSELPDKKYVKVQTVKDDPATDKVNEARYRIDEVVSDPPIRPVFAMSYYIFPVDIQSTVGWRDLLPAPTIAFSFVKPQDNIYLGFTHEVWRNVQFFWGYHFGVANELVTRNEVSEDQDSTAPATIERRQNKEFALGVTFNLAAIVKVFK